MKKILSVAVLVLCTIVSFAKTDWKGQIVDENGEAVPFANVVLLSKADSSAVSGVTTDIDGYFNIPTQAKDGILMVSIIGYETVYTSPVDGQVIRLNTSSEFLESAVATAVMPKTKVTAEGLQTSVRGSVIENIGTANDVLSRTPGLIKGQNGLEVIGRGAPLVYINGRKLTDASELDRILSSEIQSVEVISNPGAQYDASVSSVVRIKTIRRQGEGFGFNVGLTDEQSLRYDNNDPSADLNINYRHNNVDYFAGANYFKYSSRQESDLYQETHANPKYVTDGGLTNDYFQKNMSFNGGINWQIADNHSVGFKLEYSDNLDTQSHQVLWESLYKNDEIFDKLIARGETFIDKNPYSVSGNMYYNGSVGKLGIDFNADYYGVESFSKAHNDETSEMREDATIDNETTSDSYVYATKLVLSYPVWKGLFQLGTEETFTHRSDDYTITGTYIPASSSKVKESNVAGFATYALALPKIGQMSAGLRYEHVAYSYEDLLGTGSFSKSYDNVFPSLSYANVFGKVQALASFSVKTQRPGFSMLSDAIRYNSRYILQSGNASLQPQTISNASLTAIWNFVTFVADYSRIDNMIATWSSIYNDEGVVLVRPRNLEKPFRQLGAYFVLTPTVGVWTVNLTSGIQQQWLTIDAPDSQAPSGVRRTEFSDKPMFVVQLFNTFSLKKGWQLEFGGEYHSKAYNQNLYLTNNYLDVNAAIQKTFLRDGSLVVRLSAEDLAGMARYNIYTDFGNYITTQTNKMDTQRIKLSVRYRFNSAQSKYKGTGAGKDTIGRIK